MSNSTINTTTTSESIDNKNMGTQTNKPATMPEHIVLDKWADSGFEWAGVMSPVNFERLAALLADEHEQPKMQITANLYRRNNLLHLAFNVAGEVWLTCQRCLQPVAIDLTDNYDMALLEDESQMNLLDEEQDYLLLDEILIEQLPERLLPFKKLIEDEILLKTPMAPKHDDCELEIDQVGDIPEEEVENPFAALAALKGKL
ncbi:YceD family protein [Psychrobacter jeotgali]|uniref:YceD family protein n=1 Tax=Psychrobacter jeotgali TaxID=179010 RepID=UPI001919B1F3|nr:DUF177 domain-containing protein [Psychrobacter jeotgali]